MVVRWGLQRVSGKRVPRAQGFLHNLLAITSLLAACSEPTQPTVVAPIAAGDGLRLHYADEPWRYRLSASAWSLLSPANRIDTRASIEFEWRRTDGRRAFHLRNISLSIQGAGQDLELKGDPERLQLKVSGESKVDIVAGEIGPSGMSTDALFGKPMLHAEFDASGPSRLHPNADHYLVDRGLVDFGPLSIFCFPTLPVHRTQAGTSWTTSRLVPMSRNVDRELPVEMVYTVEATEACGSDTCATLRFHGDTGWEGLTRKGEEVQLRHVFDGSARLEVDRGRIVSSRFVLDMTIRVRGVEVPFNGVYDLELLE